MNLEWIKNIEFAHPVAFGLLVLLPLLVYSYAKKSILRQSTFVVSTTNAFSVFSWKNKLRHLPFILRCLTISSLIIALAQPRSRNDVQRSEGEGIDIILCMDVSGSMNSNDILPSRMEVAKEVAVQFVNSRPVDRIGLVIFSGEAFTQCPVTTDKQTLVRQISSLDSRRYLKDGTVIGEGLATAADRLTKSNAKSKVIILITDGKEDAPNTRLIDPITALDITKAHQIKVYTIGMGARATATVNQESGKNPAINFIDEELLQRIAEQTGGKYFRARDKERLITTYKEIDQLEKSKVEVQAFRRFDEQYFYFVAAALCFLFLEILLRFTLLRKFP